MLDERYYCLVCRIPVEYLPELEQYSCGRCEQMFVKEEVMPGKLIRPSSEQVLENMLKEERQRTARLRMSGWEE